MSMAYKKQETEKMCLECNKRFIGISRSKFCSKLCQGRNDAKAYVFVIDKKGNKVRRCKYIWEQQNGEMPKGKMIHHIDGNKKNDAIENLQLCSRKEHRLLHISIEKEARIMPFKACRGIF